MADYFVGSCPSSRDEVRDYILDMIGQLATLARDNGDLRLAALLERVLAATSEGAREH